MYKGYVLNFTFGSKILNQCNLSCSREDVVCSTSWTCGIPKLKEAHYLVEHNCHHLLAISLEHHIKIFYELASIVLLLFTLCCGAGVKTPSLLVTHNSF